jgi:hypothetical protein
MNSPAKLNQVSLSLTQAADTECQDLPFSRGLYVLAVDRKSIFPCFTVSFSFQTSRLRRHSVAALQTDLSY